FILDYQSKFSDLPLTGAVNTESIPWSDSYWPGNRAGIANRWNSPFDRMFSYVPPSLPLLKSMTQDRIALLSPAEKYDIYMGRYDYPTVAFERGRTSPYD